MLTLKQMHYLHRNLSFNCKSNKVHPLQAYWHASSSTALGRRGKHWISPHGP